MRSSFALLFLCIGSVLWAQTPAARQLPSGAWINYPYAVHAANGSILVRSPEEIAALNQHLSESGSLEADFQLGLAYLQGYGVAQDVVKAEGLLKQGATTPAEKELLAGLFQRAEYFPRDEDAAIQWLLSAGTPGDLFIVARMYQAKSPPDIAKATAIYRQLLEDRGTAEFRRAQMELGNLVIDGEYSAGDDAKGHALNLEWARVITQELQGQEDYKIAVDYDIGREGLAKDHAMWERFCKRAASYNIDLAQSFYGRSLIQKDAGRGALEGYAWIRLASDKQYELHAPVQQLEAKMSEAQLQTANSMFDGLMATRERDGAYYSASDPLREPSDTKLKAMAEDDPDVQLRRAFALESSGQPEDYAKAMSLYRRVRDRRKVDVRLLLWRESSEGKDGVTKDPEAATFWLKQAAFEGSPAAKLLLAGDTKGAEEERAAGDTLTPPAAPARPSLMVVPGVYHIGGGVTPPKFLHGENPEFSEQARSAKFSGRVEVYLIVDENGNPTHIRVVRGVGMGLDEKAVEAVRTYKFQPAMIDGRPVKVDLYVAVNFQIREK